MNYVKESLEGTWPRRSLAKRRDPEILSQSKHLEHQELEGEYEIEGPSEGASASHSNPSTPNSLLDRLWKVEIIKYCCYLLDSRMC